MKESSGKKIGMSSRKYRPDNWEMDLFNKSIKTAFPTDLLKDSSIYKGQLIHLLGIADSVYQLLPGTVALRLENKYWDYTEDYSVQDEVMFISPKGDGKFIVTFKGDSSEVSKGKVFADRKALMMVYAKADGVADGLARLDAVQLKFYDLFWYSTNIFSYDIMRNASGAVMGDKLSLPKITDMHFLQIAKRGQNK